MGLNYKWFWPLAWLVVSVCWALPAIAQDVGAAVATVSADDNEAQRLSARRATIAREQVAVGQDRVELDKLRAETTRQLKTLNIGQIVRPVVEQAELDVDAARVNLAGTEVELQSAEHQVASLEAELQKREQRIEELTGTQPNPAQAATELAKIQNDLARDKAFLELENQHLANLRAARFIANQRLELAVKWAQELRSQYNKARELSDQAALGDLRTRIQEEQQELLTRAAELRKRLETLQGDDAPIQTERRMLKARLQETEELSKLKPSELAMVEAKARLNGVEAVLSDGAANTQSLATALSQVDIVLRELDARTDFIQRKIVLSKQQQSVVVKRLSMASERAQAIQDSRALEKILDELNKQIKQFSFLTETAQDRRAKLQSRHEQTLRHGLLVRQTLPADTVSWQTLGQELLALPATLWQVTITPLVTALRQSKAIDLGILAAIELAWLGIILSTRRYLARTHEPASAPSFFVSALRLIARLLRANIISIGVISALLILFVACGMPQPGFGIFIIVAWVWIIYKAAIDLAQFLLLDPQISQSKTHPHLYRALRWGILAFSILTALVLLGHTTGVSPVLSGVIDRLYMLLLVPTLILILRGRVLLLSPLRPVLNSKWLRAAERIVVVLSLAMLVSVSIGLIGYTNLAWIIAVHVGLFLIVLAGWLLLRGVLRDLLKLLKNYFAGHAYGIAEPQHVLEGLIGPLGRLAQAILFLAAWWVLFMLYGWDASSPIVRDARAILLDPLFHINDRPITLLSILLTLVIILAVFRIGSWSRDLTYRWLFFKITNTGTRHSLSVFTQYAVVLIGFLIALRVLGIDLTTLTIFAGALGVGIGFGLQNIANNFISGILLLIERPVRTGDTVTIGASEGSVTRIGIRSLTVKTSDNQEVIIPNSEVISHPFTNWTYSDTVVRTTFNLAISYQNDLHLAKKIIEQHLRQHTSVARPEQAHVLLEEFGNQTVILRVHYFTDLCTDNSQEVKSMLMFQIWDSFKKAGVRFPGPADATAPPLHATPTISEDK